MPWRDDRYQQRADRSPGFAPTGKAVSIPGFDIWQFRGGLIWRYEAIYDFNLRATQLGPDPAARRLRRAALVQRPAAALKLHFRF